MARKKGCDCEPGLPGWLATFADMMTLLLTFFVLLLSMSSLDQQKLKEALGSLKGALGVLHGGTKTEVNVRELIPSLEIVDISPRKLIDQKYTEMRLEILKEKLENKVKVDMNSEGILFHLDSSVLFGIGKAELGVDAMQVLHKVAEILKENNKNIRIEGHTDNVPIQTEQYPSNWELSTARAVNVLRYFVENEEMDSRLFSAVGYGETRPVASNETQEERKNNRRVTIVMIHPKLENKKKVTAQRSDKGNGKTGIHFSTNLRKELGLKRGAQ